MRIFCGRASIKGPYLFPRRRRSRTGSTGRCRLQESPGQRLGRASKRSNLARTPTGWAAAVFANARLTRQGITPDTLKGSTIQLRSAKFAASVFGIDSLRVHEAAMPLVFPILVIPVELFSLHLITHPRHTRLSKKPTDKPRNLGDKTTEYQGPQHDPFAQRVECIHAALDLAEIDFAGHNY
jgi:hypothetical protein